MNPNIYSTQEQADILAAVQAEMNGEPWEHSHAVLTGGEWVLPSPFNRIVLTDLWRYRPAPRPKKQDQIDEEAFQVWLDKSNTFSVSATWHAALAWSRKEKL